MTLLHKIGQRPIIAALRSPTNVELAINSMVDNIFFMGGNVKEIIQAVRMVKSSGKSAFVHVDLIRGLSSTDIETIHFVADYVGADGIVTPKKHLISEAKKCNLYGVLHLFVIDSMALTNGLRTIESVKPDAVEIMPGINPKIIRHFSNKLEDTPIIGSGLIETVDEVREGLEAGATSLSVSNQKLWELTFDQLFSTQQLNN
ncbi:glycerol-3-phosphate responsive antiterminator [Metabacillus halosaccharovorans]|uniref:glycerol-3-phosphate responsive antiterminator n=1 Tax=Metabacillus halosaccharovorans TaxID=930124 RepID=UPI00203ED5A0|nr:glycerol-3-phosphate responsive antiterminator [Metabacillus halosaccharovorans]MCM3443120.1 glycerol-3-phosphate responsive antiterminator [Metabacillus halosaccharovorans]